MNEAIGNALLTKIVVFVSISIMLLFVGTLAYSKAFKSKNAIINSIEKKGSYDKAYADIEETLGSIGYLLANDNCSRLGKYVNDWKDQGWVLISTSDYDYCVYKKCVGTKSKSGICDERGEYYKVVTFMDINIPIINHFLRSSVVGETKILNKNYNY